MEEFEFEFWVDLDSTIYTDEQLLYSYVMSEIPKYNEKNKSVEEKPVFDDPKTKNKAREWPRLTPVMDIETIGPMQGIWFDNGAVRIFCTNYGVKNGYSGAEIDFDFIVENYSNKSIWAGINDDSANGWALNTGGNICNNGLAPGKKIRSNETVYLKEADISKPEELTEYEFNFWVDLDSDSYKDERIENKMKMNDLRHTFRSLPMTQGGLPTVVYD